MIEKFQDGFDGRCTMYDGSVADDGIILYDNARL